MNYGGIPISGTVFIGVKLSVLRICYLRRLFERYCYQMHFSIRFINLFCIYIHLLLYLVILLHSYI